MINKTIKHYKIIEQIGEGGMGVVYKAYDSKLNRTVALKFLPPSFSTSEERKKRFLNEAKAASALDHHNTCTIHEIDETTDGQLYIVMPSYEGQSLDQLIRQKKLSFSQILDISIQVAEGLKAAHSKNIVHRDIKSGNVIVDDDGHSVIMDFGLARMEDMPQLTQDGETLGTVNYMSPEQAVGDDVDHRTDIWSFGVILYEMLSGRVPFQSMYPQAVIYSVLNEEPEDLLSIRDDIPNEMAEIVRKALAKDRHKRYQQIDEVLDDLLRIKKSTADRPHFAVTKTGSKKKSFSRKHVSLAFLLVLLTSVAGFFYYNQSSKIEFSERDWIMLADFENKTGEDVFDQFLGGVLEIALQQSAFINLYGSNRMQEVLQSEMQKKDILFLTPDIIEEAAAFKNVNVMLIPSIEKKNQSYILSVDIRDLTSKSEIVIGPFEAADQKSVLQAIDKMARSIRLELGEPPSTISKGYTPVAKATTSSLEALKLYVEGMRLKGVDKPSGIELIEQAVQIDPEFALAHAELGMSNYIDGNSQNGEAHFQKALEQMSRLTTRERLWIQAVVEDWRGNRSEAIQQYRTYISQYPDNYHAWFRLGYAYLITGNSNECINAFSRVVEIEPREASALINLASCHNALDNTNQALEHYEKAFELRPDLKKGVYVNNEYGFMLARIGRLDEARQTFEFMLEDDENRARGLRNLALLNMFRGKLSDSIEQLNEAARANRSKNLHLSEFRDRMYLARAYLFKGMKDAFSDEMQKIESLIETMHLAPSWLADAGKLYARTGRVAKASNLLDDMESRIQDPLTVSSVNRNLSNDHGFYYMLKGEIELASGEDEEAIESMEIANNILSLKESLGYSYLAVRNFEKAISTYNEIIEKKRLGREYQQDWILAHYQMGTIYEQLGDKENATKFFQAFINIWKDGDEDIVFLADAKQRLRSLGEPIGLSTFN